MFRLLRGRYITPLFLFLFTLSIYIHNVSSDVYGGDVGDFLSAIAVKGVPHPSGYPLFTMLGILASFLPFNQPLAWKVGLVSAFSSSLAVVVMYFIVLELTKKKFVSLITALALAFSYTFWLYAEVGEAFALNNFFELLLFYVALLYYKRKKIKFLYLLSFLIGLSLSHHQIIVLLFPSLLLLILAANWKILLKPRKILICLFLLFLGLLPYLYIPLAASYNPPINWGDGKTLENLIKIILRQQYKFDASVTFSPLIRFLWVKTYLYDIFIKLTPAVVITSVLGIMYFFKKRDKILLISIFLAFFLTGTFFVAYSASFYSNLFYFGILERFYEISIMYLLLFFSFGILFIVEGLFLLLKRLNPSDQKKDYLPFFMGAFVLIPFMYLVTNFQKTNFRNVCIGDCYAYDMLSHVPANSVIFIKGDTELFNLRYLIYGKNYRKDITLFNIKGMEPEFIQRRDEIMKKNPKMDRKNVNIFTILSYVKERPVFSNVILSSEDEKLGKLEWMPHGIIFKLMDEKDNKISKEEFIRKQEAIFSTFLYPKELEKNSLIFRNLTIVDIPRIYAEGFVNTADQLLYNYNDMDGAKKYYEKSLVYNQDEHEAYRAYEGLGHYYMSKKDCKNAESVLQKAILIQSQKKLAYILLYITYNNCSGNKEKLKKLISTYKDTFNEPISKEIERRLKKD